jgi:uncharacterized protein (TIGR00725 family)
VVEVNLDAPVRYGSDGRQPILAVFGKGRNCEAWVRECAFEAGETAALAGFAVLTGGLGGCMEGALRGAARVGGQTIAITPRDDEPNAWARVCIRSGMTEVARNVIVASTCDRAIACDGSHGTLQELAVALDRGVPIVGYGTDRWTGPLDVPSILTREDLRDWLAADG